MRRARERSLAAQSCFKLTHREGPKYCRFVAIEIERREAGTVATRRPLGFPKILVIAAIVTFIGLQVLRRVAGDAPFSLSQTATPLVLILLAAAIAIVGSRQRSLLVRSVAGPVIWARATRAELSAFFDSANDVAQPTEVRDADRTGVAICPAEEPPIVLTVASRTQVESNEPIAIPAHVSLTLLTMNGKTREIEFTHGDGRTLRLAITKVVDPKIQL